MKNVTPFADAALLDPVVEVRGEITSTNFPEIRKLIRSGLENINLTPSTDEEFGQAEQDVKSLKTVETGLKTAKEEALKQAADIQALFSDIDETGEECRQARLKLDKAVKSQKEKVRAEIIESCLAEIQSFNKAHFKGRIEETLKGKRTLKSLKSAAKKERIQINAELEAASEIITRYKSEHGDSIALDSAKLELMSAEALEVELSGRVQRLAAEQARRKAEAEAAAAKAEAEQSKKAAEQAANPKPLDPQDEPRKVGSIPVGNPRPESPTDPEADQEAEWAEFKGSFFAALGPVKQAKEKLTNPENQRRAQVLSNAINTAWKEVSA